MIDYEKLGAMLGSAWRDNHPNQPAEISIYVGIARSIIAHEILPPNSSTKQGADLGHSLWCTMQGRCYRCASLSEVGRDESGVYVCTACHEQEGQ